MCCHTRCGCHQAWPCAPLQVADREAHQEVDADADAGDVAAEARPREHLSSVSCGHSMMGGYPALTCAPFQGCMTRALLPGLLLVRC